jgi:precorrin-6Y C5,15-methyltransferase (decarboxylating)
MREKNIIVIGIGEEGLDGMAIASRQLIERADILVGGMRHLSKVSIGSEMRVDWSNGIKEALVIIEKNHKKSVVVLASGDPLNFGIGKNIIQRFGVDSVKIIPAPGAFSLAAARMGWALPDVNCLTVHGRAISSVSLHLIEGERLLILSRDGATPAELAALLASKGFGPSEITVLANMGGDETRLKGIAEEWDHELGSDLNTIAVLCRTKKNCEKLSWSRASGLPDDAFEHDGQITKREVRAATIARLAPLPRRVLWDVGAGSGSIGIEWLRCEPSAKVIAIESDLKRVARIEQNAKNLGVPNLEVIQGEAPEILSNITISPDVIFVGGGISVKGLLEACWSFLPIGGRLVANGVTAEAEQSLLQFRKKHDGDLVRLSISRSNKIGKVGGYSAFKPMMAVTQLITEKN